MKIKLPVDKKKLQDVINDIELKYTDPKTGELTITNRSQLADIISNTNVSSLIGQTEGTILIKGAQFDRGPVFRIRNNTNFTFLLIILEPD
jgi:hypothetical protein